MNEGGAQEAHEAPLLEGELLVIGVAEGEPLFCGNMAQWVIPYSCPYGQH